MVEIRRYRRRMETSGKVAVVTGAGAGLGAALARLCNRPGPVTLRANVAVGGRDALRSTLAAAGVDARAGALSPWAVHLGGDRAAWGGGVWALPGWRAGAFEVQDEGSQCIASACAATAGEIALDLCAGNRHARARLRPAWLAKGTIRPGKPDWDRQRHRRKLGPAH